jgi:hypothetical protein
VIELQLIGYTEDAEHLVLDLEADGDGGYTVRIDPDLLATVAERERVLAEARRRTLDVPGARPLGDSVDEALAARGIDEEQRRWSATRRDDGRWRVTVRFEDDGRPRTASWTMDPGGERIRPASRLAGDLAGPTSRSTRRR